MSDTATIDRTKELTDKRFKELKKVFKTDTVEVIAVTGHLEWWSAFVYTAISAELTFHGAEGGGEKTVLHGARVGSSFGLGCSRGSGAVRIRPCQ